MSNERHREGESPANYDTRPALAGVRKVIDEEIALHAEHGGEFHAGAVAALCAVRARLFPPPRFAPPDWNDDRISPPPAKEPTDAK